MGQTRGDLSDWYLPQWSQTQSLALMDSLSIKTAILSVTAPGPPILHGTAAAKLARSCNEDAAAIRDSDPSRFGFFANLPCLQSDPDLALAEIAYCLDHLGADGVTLYSRYGAENHYLGHPSFRAIWAELDKRRAVVFVHPTHSVETDLVNAMLAQPMIDYCHETCRAAVDLVSMNTIREFPNVKIILAHAGGTLPYLADRVFNLLPDCGFTKKTTEECWEDCRKFYYDTALSANEYTLPLITKFAARGRILFGSDFPYAPTKTITTMTKRLDVYGFEDGEKEREAVDYGNAMELFPRLKAYL